MVFQGIYGTGLRKLRRFQKGYSLSNYSIFQQDIFRMLKEGKAPETREDFFYEVISGHSSIVAARFNSKVILSPTRLHEAQVLWINDLEGMIEGGKISQPTVEPCEYKHAAFLCYWLRRRVIVESCSRLDTEAPVSNLDFNRFKSEFIALHVSLELLGYHVFSEGAQVGSDMSSSVVLSNDFVHEMLVLLHHKNVSPHSLYLIFKALFVSVTPFQKSKQLRLVAGTEAE